MWILIVVFSGLSFVQDEPLLAESTYSIVFHNERRCVAAQEWLTKNTDSKAKCFKK